MLLLFPILLKIRGSYFQRISQLSNWGLIISGFLLFFYQINGFFTDNENNMLKHLNHDKKHEHHHGDKKHSHN